jgi:cysteine desulfurase / selenocysteine lyase
VSTPLDRGEFAVTQRYVYLNHAATGVLPQSTVSTIEEYIHAHAQAGVLGTFPYDLRVPEYRAKIGKFIGAGGNEIATIPNTSIGANIVALGIDWQPGDRVVLCDNEFPANAVPWMALRERGVEIVELGTDEERLTPDALRRAISPRTRVVTVSWVSYSDGYRHDLSALAEVAHEAGALFVVDAIQGLGVFPIDVRAMGIDALYSGAGKWMLALHGAGFLYIREDLIDRLHLAMPGWRSVRDMWDFHNHDQDFTPEAMRFEAGTPNYLGALVLASSVDLFERAGQAAIAEHVLALTDRLVEGLERVRAEIRTLRGDGISSGIVTFRLPGVDSSQLGRALQQEGVVTTYRESGIRVSPHGYNTIDEIDHLLDLVPQLTSVR